MVQNGDSFTLSVSVDHELFFWGARKRQQVPQSAHSVSAVEIVTRQRTTTSLLPSARGTKTNKPTALVHPFAMETEQSIVIKEPMRYGGAGDTRDERFCTTLMTR